MTNKVDLNTGRIIDTGHIAGKPMSGTCRGCYIIIIAIFGLAYGKSVGMKQGESYVRGEAVYYGHATISTNQGKPTFQWKVAR